MTHETKTVGHLVVKIPISRSLGEDEEGLTTTFSFEPFQLLNEKLDDEYLAKFIQLMDSPGRVEMMLDYTDRTEMVTDLMQSLEQKLHVLKETLKAASRAS